MINKIRKDEKQMVNLLLSVKCEDDVGRFNVDLHIADDFNFPPYLMGEHVKVLSYSTKEEATAFADGVEALISLLQSSNKAPKLKAM